MAEVEDLGSLDDEAGVAVERGAQNASRMSKLLMNYYGTSGAAAIADTISEQEEEEQKDKESSPSPSPARTDSGEILLSRLRSRGGGSKEIDSPNFSAEVYAESLMRNASIGKLSSRVKVLRSECAALEESSKELVAANYDKFIDSAALVRQRTRTDVVSMENSFSLLENKLVEIKTLNIETEDRLSRGMQGVEEMARIAPLLKQLQALLDLPARLVACEANGTYETAVEDIQNAWPVLETYGHYTQLRSVKEDVSQSTGRISAILRQKMLRAEESSADSVEHLILLSKIPGINSTLEATNWIQARSEAVSDAIIASGRQHLGKLVNIFNALEEFISGANLGSDDLLKIQSTFDASSNAGINAYFTKFKSILKELREEMAAEADHNSMRAVRVYVAQMQAVVKDIGYVAPVLNRLPVADMSARMAEQWTQDFITTTFKVLLANSDKLISSSTDCFEMFAKYTAKTYVDCAAHERKVKADIVAFIKSEFEKLMLILEERPNFSGAGSERSVSYKFIVTHTSSGEFLKYYLEVCRRCSERCESKDSNGSPGSEIGMCRLLKFVAEDAIAETIRELRVLEDHVDDGASDLDLDMVQHRDLKIFFDEARATIHQTMTLLDESFVTRVVRCCLAGLASQTSPAENESCPLRSGLFQVISSAETVVNNLSALCGDDESDSIRQGVGGVGTSSYTTIAASMMMSQNVKTALQDKYGEDIIHREIAGEIATIMGDGDASSAVPSSQSFDISTPEGCVSTFVLSLSSALRHEAATSLLSADKVYFETCYAHVHLNLLLQDSEAKVMLASSSSGTIADAIRRSEGPSLLPEASSVGSQCSEYQEGHLSLASL